MIYKVSGSEVFPNCVAGRITSMHSKNRLSNSSLFRLLTHTYGRIFSGDPVVVIFALHFGGERQTERTHTVFSIFFLCRAGDIKIR